MSRHNTFCSFQVPKKVALKQPMAKQNTQEKAAEQAVQPKAAEVKRRWNRAAVLCAILTSGAGSKLAEVGRVRVRTDALPPRNPRPRARARAHPSPPAHSILHDYSSHPHL